MTSKSNSQFPRTDSEYFTELKDEDEDAAVFRKYLSMSDADDTSGPSSASSYSSVASNYGVNFDSLGITPSQIDEFIKKTEEYSASHRRNSLLDKVPHSQYLPYFLKNLLATQVEAKDSEEGRPDWMSVDPDGYTGESGSGSGDEEGEDSEGTEAVEALEIEPPETVLPQLDVDKGRAFYIDKEIGRRPGQGPNLADGIDERLHRRWSRTVWRQEMENLEPEYRLPILILKKFRYIRQHEPGRIGPGTYDVDYYQIQKDKKNRTTRGIMKACSLRFPKERLANENPGPGTYGHLHFEDYEDHCRHPGRVPLLQSGPCNVRGDTFKEIGSRLGPGQYEFKSGIQMLMDRKVSSRGPYDVYTPSRSIIPYGYMKSVPGSPLGPGEYTIRTSLTEEFAKPEHRLKGLFSKYDTKGKTTGERITLMSPLWPVLRGKHPGPGSHDPVPYTRVFKKNRHPFCQTAAARPDSTGDYDMSPDKYRPELGPIYCPLGCGHKSAFVSTANRIDLSKIGVLTERLRGKDLPPDHFTKITWAKPNYCIR